jgi:methionyl-tRNA formyltransferase
VHFVEGERARAGIPDAAPGSTSVEGGVDTGGILAAREVPLRGVASRRDLHRRLDVAKVDLLADVIGAFAAGRPLPALEQRLEDGRRHFEPHPALGAILDEKLARAAARRSEAA